MKTIAEIRLYNLRLLIGEFGTQEQVAALADTSPVYISQILNGAADSKTGKVGVRLTAASFGIRVGHAWPLPRRWRTLAPPSARSIVQDHRTIPSGTELGKIISHQIKRIA
jgi:hypothetical protein